MCVCHNISNQCGFGNLCRCKCMCVKNEFTINKHCYFFNLLFIIFYQLKIENKLQFFLEILFIFLTKKHNFSLFHDFYLACQLPCQLVHFLVLNPLILIGFLFIKLIFLEFPIQLHILIRLEMKLKYLFMQSVFHSVQKMGGRKLNSFRRFMKSIEYDFNNQLFVLQFCFCHSIHGPFNLMSSFFLEGDVCDQYINNQCTIYIKIY